MFAKEINWKSETVLASSGKNIDLMNYQKITLACLKKICSLSNVITPNKKFNFKFKLFLDNTDIVSCESIEKEIVHSFKNVYPNIDIKCKCHIPIYNLNKRIIKIEYVKR